MSKGEKGTREGESEGRGGGKKEGGKRDDGRRGKGKGEEAEGVREESLEGLQVHQSESGELRPPAEIEGSKE